MRQQVLGDSTGGESSYTAQMTCFPYGGPRIDTAIVALDGFDRFWQVSEAL